MSQWDDPIAWAQFRSVEACVICRQGTPNDMLAEHGNSLPHLHMPFFPRYPGDPFAGGPIPAGGTR